MPVESAAGYYSKFVVVLVAEMRVAVTEVAVLFVNVVEYVVEYVVLYIADLVEFVERLVQLVELVVADCWNLIFEHMVVGICVVLLSVC